MTLDARTHDAYARHARAYVDDWLSQPRAVDLEAAVRRHFARGASTIDVGCGGGRDVDWLNRNGYPCIGVDASEALLAEARARFPSWRFERGELPALDGIGDASFEQVVCETVVMHLPRDAAEASIRKLVRIARPGGTIYCSWRVEPVDRRDTRGRLYTALDTPFVVDALGDVEVLETRQVTSASSGRPIAIVVARKVR